jgi:hypothetical protein
MLRELLHLPRKDDRIGWWSPKSANPHLVDQFVLSGQAHGDPPLSQLNCLIWLFPALR